MANTKSAKKAVRKLARRRAVNTLWRSRMRTYVRKVEDAVEAGDKKAAQTALREAQPHVMRAGQKISFTAIRQAVRFRGSPRAFTRWAAEPAFHIFLHMIFRAYRRRR